MKNQKKEEEKLETNIQIKNPLKNISLFLKKISHLVSPFENIEKKKAMKLR